jgi:hypothetical protein
MANESTLDSVRDAMIEALQRGGKVRLQRVCLDKDGKTYLEDVLISEKTSASEEGA